MDYDLIIVGGGLAGSAMATAMARTGAQVLVVEREPAFRDRVRGEGMLPWGVAEARELGIYDRLLTTLRPSDAVADHAGQQPRSCRDDAGRRPECWISIILRCSSVCSIWPSRRDASCCVQPRSSRSFLAIRRPSRSARTARRVALGQTGRRSRWPQLAGAHAVRLRLSSATRTGSRSPGRSIAICGCRTMRSRWW